MRVNSDSANISGKTCPFCQTLIKPNINVIVCDKCKTPHHEECWIENGKCTTFGCNGSIKNNRVNSNSTTYNPTHRNSSITSINRQSVHQNSGIGKIIVAIIVIGIIAGIVSSLLASNYIPILFDGIWFIVALIIIFITFYASPLKKIINSPELLELRRNNPDISNTTSLLNGLIAGGVTFTVAKLVDMTGFAAFTTTTSIISPVVSNFTLTHLGMSALGIILTPHIYISLSIITGLIPLLLKIKRGTTLLNDAIKKVRIKKFNEAYTYALQASKKWLLKPSNEKINEWKDVLNAEIRDRNYRIEELRASIQDPHEKCIEGAIIGVIIGLSIGIIGLLLKLGSSWIITLSIISMGILCMERNLSLKINKVIKQAPILQMELYYLQHLINIRF